MAYISKKKVKICKKCNKEFTLPGNAKDYAYKNGSNFYCSYKCFKDVDVKKQIHKL